MTVELTHPEKKIFTHYTKQHYVDYYSKIASLILPYIQRRPLTMYRFPEGAGKEGFYQKDMPDYFPPWMNHTKIRHKERVVNYPVCNNKQSLLYLASQVAELHTWTSTTDHLEYPNKMIFDLDPPGKNLDILRKIAQMLESLLSDIGFTPFLMSTGKRGYHVVVPLKPEQNNRNVREFAVKIATVIIKDNSRSVTTDLIKEKRKGRVFIDVNRNSPYQTSIAPYSVRAVPEATVALPLEWAELRTVNPHDYDIDKTLKRIQRKQDPWTEFTKKSVSLKKIIRRLKT